MITATGKLYVAGKSECLPVNLRFEHDEVAVERVEGDELKHQYKLQELTVSPKLGNVPREVKLPEKGLLVVDSSAEIDDWLDKGKNSHYVAKFEKSIE